jgi:hypothetical protein
VKLQKFENKVFRELFGPRKDELNEQFRLLHYREPCDLCGSLSIVRVVKYIGLWWSEHVARMVSEARKVDGTGSGSCPVVSFRLYY